MIHKVYKSLDSSSSFFGMVGSYATYFFVALGISAFASFMAAKFIPHLMAVALFVALTVLSYLGTMAFQMHFKGSERLRDKWMTSFRMPDSVSMKPVRLSSYLKYDFDSDGTAHERERKDN